MELRSTREEMSRNSQEQTSVALVSTRALVDVSVAGIA